MRKLLQALLLMVFIFSAKSAFAAGGTCPAGANYVNPSNPTGPLVTLSSAYGITSCYYIDTGGSDSNAGSSESSPWAHAPGMPTCSGVCSSTFPYGVTASAAGTGFIFKGGDTWGGANFQMTWTWYGTSNNQVYIGVDPSWATGTWTRPVFTCGGATCSGGKIGRA